MIQNIIKNMFRASVDNFLNDADMNELHKECKGKSYLGNNKKKYI